MLPRPIIRLECGVNSYDWGKVGPESAAAQFAAATAQSFSIEPEKPYAELWMGTHPSLPSRDHATQVALADTVKQNAALMSIDIHRKYSGKLPFLYKVLSIRKALSIQAHPNKKLAEQLHAKDPKNYPDDNHKPEMAIAITAFDGLCGFRPLAEITHFLQHVPALRKAVGDDAASAFESAIKGKETSEDESEITKNKEALRACFTALMNSKPEDITSYAKELISAAEGEGDKFAGEGGASNTGSELSELVVRLNKQFPGDIGLFVLFFTNYVKMQPGEGIFLKADDIHAYLSGDIIECMAASDNVVRAGFTPKFKDVDTLTSMLTYSYAPISEQKMAPVDFPYAFLSAAAYTSKSTAILYDPPIEEFSVIKTELKVFDAKATFDPVDGPSILICTGGNGTITVADLTLEVAPGYVFFVGATADLILQSSGTEPFVTYKAFCELNLDEISNGN